MRPTHKELEYEPRSRPPKRRKSGRKRFAIEYRWAYSEDCCFTRSLRRNRRHVWAVWKRYHTEKQRDRALQNLRSKPPMQIGEKKFGPMYEFRREPEVKFTPLQDNIVVEYDEPKDRTDGGILLPDICKTPPTEALVISQGPGRRASNGELIPMPCYPGQKVLVSLSGIEMDNPDPDSKKKHRLITAGDVLAVKE